MNCNPHDTVEQHAIELVSSLGKEHLFVANCPSDIDSNRYSGTVITYEEAFDHSDTGVGLCLLLPKAYVLQKFIDICLNKDISVHFVFTYDTELKPNQKQLKLTPYGDGLSTHLQI